MRAAARRSASAASASASSCSRRVSVAAHSSSTGAATTSHAAAAQENKDFIFNRFRPIADEFLKAQKLKFAAGGDHPNHQMVWPKDALKNARVTVERGISPEPSEVCVAPARLHATVTH